MYQLFLVFLFVIFAFEPIKKKFSTVFTDKIFYFTMKCVTIFSKSIKKTDIYEATVSGKEITIQFSFKGAEYSVLLPYKRSLRGTKYFYIDEEGEKQYCNFLPQMEITYIPEKYKTFGRELRNGKIEYIKTNSSDEEDSEKLIDFINNF